MAQRLSAVTAASVRSMRACAAEGRTLPVAVVAVTACFLVAATTPEQAAASTVDRASSALTSHVAAAATQDFTAPDSAPVVAERDGFGVRVVAGRTQAVGDVGGGADVVLPVAGTVPTAGGFGSRWVRGCGACSTNHQGLDFAAPTGTPARAAMPGRVVSAGVLGGYGNQVLVQHADGVQTRYGHLSAITVVVGQTVDAGQQVGAVGSTGVSTGPHLHFEVIVGGHPVDPAAWLHARGLL